MITAKNHRIYLVLDPDEAIDLQMIIMRSAATESIAAVDGNREAHLRRERTMLKRLDAAIERAKEKGAKFSNE